MTAVSPNPGRWQFWIDRGGTFTDVVARGPDGAILSRKLLSENPGRYDDAALQGIRDVLGVAGGAPIPAEQIESVKMGTTVATNALLERKGEPTVLAITQGFGDALRIAYQSRPELFTRHIVLPEMLYASVVEIPERLSARGEVLLPMDLDAASRDLQAAFDAGIRSVAIVLMHAYRYFQHERRLAGLAREIGFTQVSVSHEVSPLMKLVSRGDTTVVDAYLSPILRRYVDRIAGELKDTRLLFMQSNGGLADAHRFQGKDSILSGPAGGVVGAAHTSDAAGLGKIIAFDMGGTSTDVSHYDGEYERTYESLIAGVRMRVPMMYIHTVAAGGGSILRLDGTRLRVGPESAGADPGPACYRRGGPLTVTDCNVMVGKLLPEWFPWVFGPKGNAPLDDEIVREKFQALAEQVTAVTGESRTLEALAHGGLQIAVENMANAIRKISVQRGHDVSEYALCCFGGAGGQHACQVADVLGISRVFIHAHAGVLSAYGMGLADLRWLRQQAVEAMLEADLLAHLQAEYKALEDQGREELAGQGVSEARMQTLHRLHLRYEGTDTPIVVDYGPPEFVIERFEATYRERYGFIETDKPLIVEAIAVEVVGASGMTEAAPKKDATVVNSSQLSPLATVNVYTSNAARDGVNDFTAPVFQRDRLSREPVTGPAIIIEVNNTIVVEPGWQARLEGGGNLFLERVVPLAPSVSLGTAVDPVRLEIFNNLFVSIAEQMGTILERTSHSVNIKERLDFSCAVFDRDGELVANAPHVPVHLGSMGESVQSIIRVRAGTMKPGDDYVLNAPYHGGTHLPDITVVSPVFDEAGGEILFYVASRGHHADIGGITPGSMPPASTSVDQEGVLIDNFQMVDRGRFREAEMHALLTGGEYPARNPQQNIADLKAQIAANEAGGKELRKMVAHYGLETIRAYMQHVQGNAEESVRRVIDALTDGAFTCLLDDGSRIQVRITVDRSERCARIDFSDSSSQQVGNFNAPAAVCKAAVLYVFRTLVDADIPLNAGCLKPLEIVIPPGSLLHPEYPAAVVAGNVETSQCIVDVLYGALGVMAASQGSMNNFTFGDERWQYYETLCGGTGAGPDHDGTDAVHSNMTNSRLTDPEVLEWRFPVLLERFAIRRGSGGAGRHRGGDGVVRRLRFLQPMTAAILSSRRRVAPYGLGGGEEGMRGHNWVERADGKVVELGGCDQIEMQCGDVFVIETPGGGGFGRR